MKPDLQRLHPQSADQAGGDVSGDAEAAILLVAGDRAPGHGSDSPVHRAIVISVPRQSQLDGGFHGIAACAGTGVIYARCL